MKDKEYIRVLILRTIGNFLVLGSLFLIAKTFYNPIKEEVRYNLDRFQKKQYVVSTSAVKKTIPKGELAKYLAKGPVEIITPEDPNFSIVVPKIAANARILSNVSAVDENVYLEALKGGVAHASGTAFPGEGGHIYLFAHSTDYLWNVGSYNAVFYLLYKLKKDDEINVFYNGQRYVYRVIGNRVVDPSDVGYLTRKTNTEFLTLQTCWPPGTTLKRLLVFAVREAQ